MVANVNQCDSSQGDQRRDGATPLQELGGVNDLLSGEDLSLHSPKVEVDSKAASSSRGAIRVSAALMSPIALGHSP